MSKGIFAEWLVSTMNQNRVTASKISEKSGFHHNVVRNWMRGRSLPNSCSLVSLIDSLADLTPYSWEDLIKEASEVLRKENQ